MRVVILSHFLTALLVTTRCDARSTRVSAQYSVSDGIDGSELSTRTFGPRGIVEDAVIEDGGILTKLNARPTRITQRVHKRRQPTANPSPDYEQLPFKPEFFAVKGKVLDDIEPIPKKPKTRPTRVKSHTHSSGLNTSSLKGHSQQLSTKNPFRFPSIQNEEIFESKLQEAPSIVNTKKYRSPEGGEEQFFTSYSTIKFTGADANDEGYVGKVKTKAPKRSTSVNPSQLFKLEQSFGGQQQFKYDTDLGQTGYKSTDKYSHKPAKTLFKSQEDEFKDSEFFDFSIRPRPGQSSSAIVSAGSSGAKYGKLKSDLGVKALAIKAHKNKFDPQLQGGFEPSFKLRDYPYLHGSEPGSGVASSGQIKTYYDKEESFRDERYKQKLLSDPSPASKAQFAQFLRAKEDERLERLVEEQFRLRQQKQIAEEKEAELKLQQQVLQRQKDKIKAVEKKLNEKVTRQSTRQKRRPNSQSSRRQRNPTPLNFSVGSNGHSQVPLRTVTGKDGTYRVSFNIQ